jgi:hypothetical protein
MQGHYKGTGAEVKKARGPRGSMRPLTRKRRYAYLLLPGG